MAGQSFRMAWSSIPSRPSTRTTVGKRPRVASLSTHASAVLPVPVPSRRIGGELLLWEFVRLAGQWFR